MQRVRVGKGVFKQRCVSRGLCSQMLAALETILWWRRMQLVPFVATFIASEGTTLEPLMDTMGPVWTVPPKRCNCKYGH